jgi:chemotaxis protein MotA
VVGIVTCNGRIDSFLNMPSVFIVIGGSLSSLLSTNTINDFIAGMKTITLIFKIPVLEIKPMILKIIELSNVARKEGLLALEESANELNDPFLKKGILLIVDGTDPDLVRAIMETELSSIEARHKKKIIFWETLGLLGPVWGMMGTLIGLIIALGNLSDVSSLGPTMAMTFITTMYGSMQANMLCNPAAGKLKTQNENEMMVKEIMIEGLLSIQAGENPRVIEEKLKSFLAPNDRGAEEPADAGGAGGEAA